MRLTRRDITGLPYCPGAGYVEILRKLANYEDAEEQGLLVPVKHGRWIWNPDGMDWGLGAWCCSECKSKAETWWDNDRRYNPLYCSGGHFCGNCGAKMGGDGDV